MAFGFRMFRVFRGSSFRICIFLSPTFNRAHHRGAAAIPNWRGAPKRRGQRNGGRGIKTSAAPFPCQPRLRGVVWDGVTRRVISSATRSSEEQPVSPFDETLSESGFVPGMDPELRGTSYPATQTARMTPKPTVLGAQASLPARTPSPSWASPPGSESSRSRFALEPFDAGFISIQERPPLIRMDENVQRKIDALFGRTC